MTGSDDTAGALDSFSAQEQALLRELERAEAGVTQIATPTDEGMEEFLLFWLGETPYLAPLAHLREVLPEIPPYVALPFSPTWLWGIFPLRTELAALVDPAPVLKYGPEAAQRLTDDAAPRATPWNGGSQAKAPRALVVGEDEQVVALVADHLGAIVLLRADDRSPYTPGAMASAPAAQSKYVTGVYQLPDQPQPALALEIERLCADIFAAIEERSADE